jgi:hypothetical protein
MRRNYLRVVSRIVPLGAVSASLLLGSVLPSRAADTPLARESAVSERLTAIREAVLVAIGPGEIGKLDDPDFHLIWGNRWNNGGWNRRRGWGRGRPAWNNWRNGWPNWNNFWRNW